MSDFFDGETVEPTVDTTSNIEFQLNRFSDDEYFKNKYVPENAIFALPDIIANIKSLYEHNLDIPILVYGGHGYGKLTCILGLLPHIPSYLPDYAINNKVNNIHFFKILDADFNKIFFYENIFYLNMEILNNNNEIIDYLKYMYQIAKASNITIYDDIEEDSGCVGGCSSGGVSSSSSGGGSIDNKKTKVSDKKIIIFAHIDKCNSEAQRYIAFMLDKINNNVSYIFTTYSTNTIDKKIMTSCAPVNFKHIDESIFENKFVFNFKKSFAKDEIILTKPILKQFYQLYISNQYNIGNTISQIKYYLATQKTSFLKHSNDTTIDTTYTTSLMSQIAANFIKKKLVLSNVSSALEIRKFLYIMLSLNMKLIIFIKEVVRQLLKSKLNPTVKQAITQKASTLSAELIDVNKEIVIIETFIYDIINIIYGKTVK